MTTASLNDPFVRTRDNGVDAKVVLMGSQGVGKTSLLQRYVQGKFEPKSITSTTGAFFVTKKVVVNGVRVRLQLWDTAGQERFRSMAPIYYRGANAALLLYDITNLDSFNDVRSWLLELRKNSADDLLIYIVGSKLDLAWQRQVTEDRVRAALHSWFPPPRPPSPPTPPQTSSTFSYIRPRFTSFTSSLALSPPSATAGLAIREEGDASRPTDLKRARTTSLPQRPSNGITSLARSNTTTGRPPHSAIGPTFADSTSSALPPRTANNVPFTRFPVMGRPNGAWTPPSDGVGLTESEEETEDDEPGWGLEKGMRLFEVSSKDSTGVQTLFDALISAIISRKEAIEQENEQKRRDSVFLQPTMTPAWESVAEAEEAREKDRTSNGWSSCCAV